MNVIKTPIEGLFIIEPRIFEDLAFSKMLEVISSKVSRRGNSKRRLARLLLFRTMRANRVMVSCVACIFSAPHTLRANWFAV